MKNWLKRCLSLFVLNDLSWGVLESSFLRLSRFFERERGQIVLESPRNRMISDAIKTLIPDLVVKHGVFSGMKYPGAVSVGSSLFPKLLGSYEQELNPVIKRICREEYSEIVDVGCAEGYYAVGLALRIPQATVFAFDTNPQALQMCKSMARLNGVADRLVAGSYCDAETLRAIHFSRRGLVIADCEGYEKQLFTEKTVNRFATCDLLIELHDFMDISISGHLRQLFERTHDIETIQSVDDIKKAQSYHYAELEPYELHVRKTLLAEQRPAVMEWFWMKAKDRRRCSDERGKHTTF